MYLIQKRLIQRSDSSRLVITAEGGTTSMRTRTWSTRLPAWRRQSNGPHRAARCGLCLAFELTQAGTGSFCVLAGKLTVRQVFAPHRAFLSALMAGDFWCHRHFEIKA